MLLRLELDVTFLVTYVRQEAQVVDVKTETFGRYPYTNDISCQRLIEKSQWPGSE